MWNMKVGLSYLDDVAVRVFGVSADKHGEERWGAVVGWHHAQNFLEVVLVPVSSQGPSSYLKQRLGKQFETARGKEIFWKTETVRGSDQLNSEAYFADQLL